MPDTTTKDTPQTRATLKYLRTSAYKVREVLDLIRGLDVDDARHVLQFNERGPAREVLKVMNSAVANADHTLNIPPDELFVSVAYADEGPTIKRWRPRARGRATRIRKRTCHITIIVGRLPEDRLRRIRARQAADTASRRARRVAGGRRAAAEQAVARGRRTRRGAREPAEAAEPTEVAEAAEAAPAAEQAVEETQTEEAAAPEAQEPEA